MLVPVSKYSVKFEKGSWYEFLDVKVVEGPFPRRNKGPRVNRAVGKMVARKKDARAGVLNE